MKAKRSSYLELKNFSMYYGLPTMPYGHGEYVGIPLFQFQYQRKNTFFLQQNIKQEIDNNRRQNNPLVLKQLIEFVPWVIFVFRSWGRLLVSVAQGD